jgi:hypothetical protein
MSTDRIRNVNRQSKKLKNKTNHKYKVEEISSDDFGRILSCETYIITNVYYPNDSGVRKTFIGDIDPYGTDGSLTEKIHIFTGDFNCVLDKEIDRYPSRNNDDTGWWWSE